MKSDHQSDSEVILYKNVFQEGELDRNRVVANFATTATDGKTYQVEFYNLDVIQALRPCHAAPSAAEPSSRSLV